MTISWVSGMPPGFWLAVAIAAGVVLIVGVAMPKPDPAWWLLGKLGLVGVSVWVLVMGISVMWWAFGFLSVSVVVGYVKREIAKSKDLPV